MRRSSTLIALAALLLDLLVAPTAGSAGYANPDLLVSTDGLAKQLGAPDARIVDVRGPDEYKAGHIPGAVSFPTKEFSVTNRGVAQEVFPEQQLATKLGALGIGLDTRVVVYDEAASPFATRLFWTLEYLGHGKVSVLDGGFKKWAVESRPMETEAPVVQAVTFTAKLQPTRHADAAYVLVNLETPGVVIVDARTVKEYRAEITGNNVARAGRVPGAVGVAIEEHQAKQGGAMVFKDAGTLAKLYEAVGVTKDKEVIVYCRTGLRATHSYLTLRLLGYPKVRMYDGSWIEWGNRPELPFEK